jgi:hypothetical protein
MRRGCDHCGCIRLVFGAVDLIIEIPHFHPFLAVRWFRPALSRTPSASSEDVLSGVIAQYVRPLRAQREDNMWISIEDVHRVKCLHSSELGICFTLI